MRKSDLLSSSNDWVGALSVLEDGLNFYKGTTFTLRIAEFYKEVGEFYWKEENPLKSYELSIANFEQALNLGKELKIPRLEAALLNSMWKACRSFEKWKECAEYSILHNQAEAYAHAQEVDIYVKKIEQSAHEEKQRLVKEGKPTYSKSLLDEVVQLRDENEKLRHKTIQLHETMSEIEYMIEKRTPHRNNHVTLLEQIHRIVSRNNNEKSTIEDVIVKCDTLYPNFTKVLRTHLPTITRMEMKVAKMIRLGMSTQSIAMTCGVTIKSIENHRTKLRKKANLTQKQSLSTYIHAM